MVGVATATAGSAAVTGNDRRVSSAAGHRDLASQPTSLRRAAARPNSPPTNAHLARACPVVATPETKRQRPDQSPDGIPVDSTRNTPTTCSSTRAELNGWLGEVAGLRTREAHSMRFFGWLVSARIKKVRTKPG